MVCQHSLKMKRSRYGFWWHITNEELIEVAQHSQSYSDICRYYKLRAAGGNIHGLKERLELAKIEFKPTWKPGAHIKPVDLSQVFIENSMTARNTIRKYAIKHNLIPYRCVMTDCPNPEPLWNGKSISLVLDHINGIFNDHRLENLRFLCPNCNSQTDTFAGRSLRKAKIKDTDPEWRTRPKLRLRHVQWPSAEELSELIQTNTWVALGRKFGVTDNAVRKWARKYGII